MGWGNPFREAWNAATEKGKELARRAASAAIDKGKELASDAYDWGKQKAAQVYEAAQAKARDKLRDVADSGYDSVAGGVEKARRAKETVRKGYGKVREAFGAQPAGSPICNCPGNTKDGIKDADRDGWMMAPQGPGKPCVAVPPGKTALADARAKAVPAQSPCCTAKRAGQPTRDIVYVNGINTNQADHCETLNQIAAQTCGRVVGVYNATEGMSADAMQTGQDRRLIKAASSGKSIPTQDGRNPAVDTLSKTISQELRAGRPPEIWAHSQGGAVTSLSLFQARNDRAIATGNPDPLAGVKIKSFGAAAPTWPDGPGYEHYVHVNDATPSLFGLGHGPAGDAANAGAGAKVIRFAGDPAGGPFTRPDLDWTPAGTSNHGVGDTYLKMEKQINGGCP